MTNDRFPTGHFAEEVLVLQRELNAGGYGPVQVDGWFGAATKAALDAREQDLAKMPAPAKPWWETRRGKGAAKLAAGALVSVVGLFWGAAQNIDAAQAVEIIYAAGPQIDAALALARQLLETLGLLLGALGLGQTLVGAWAAKGPIDAALLARVGERELRVPTDSVRADGTNGRSGPDGVHADRGGSDPGYWSGRRGPFDSES